MLIAGRDDVFHRFLGRGDPEPRPTACIVVEHTIVGWVDYDLDRAWREPGEVNVGYNVFAPHRGKGYASRAVQLLMHHLAVATDHRVATLLIDPDNARSLALAHRLRFTPAGDLDGNPYFKRDVPPLTYSDGGVTIRRPTPSELGATTDEFVTGPRWTFAVDLTDARDVARVACDLRDANRPTGDADISYAVGSSQYEHDDALVSRAVRLALAFLHDHTAATAGG